MDTFHGRHQVSSVGASVLFWGEKQLLCAPFCVDSEVASSDGATVCRRPGVVAWPALGTRRSTVIGVRQLDSIAFEWRQHARGSFQSTSLPEGVNLQLFYVTAFAHVPHFSGEGSCRQICVDTWRQGNGGRKRQRVANLISTIEKVATAKPAKNPVKETNPRGCRHTLSRTNSWG